MRILITGICGFAGNAIARALLAHAEGLKIFGIDSLCRRGSETNLPALRNLGCTVQVADLRDPTVLARHEPVDWLIDAAANPSVLAGISNDSPSRELLDTNLFSTVAMLEFCRLHGATFTLLSTSRVYGIEALRAIPLELRGNAFRPAPGASPYDTGIPEAFSSEPPLSLYGTSKFCAERLVLEYGSAFGFPVWINRCGVLAGAGQFGKADQGIFSFWLHSWASKKPLRYLGFGGHGHQVRDCLHPEDLVPVLLKQAAAGKTDSAAQVPRVANLSGGIQSARSLLELSEWCADRFGPHAVSKDPQERPFDLPWVVLDSTLAQKTWDWYPSRNMDSILEEIAGHAESNPHWLELCS